jgi:prepilin-type N-terminal cleavage/methylation domain-containing protein
VTTSWRGGQDSEAGFSLIETLVAIVVLSLVAAAGIGGLLTAVSTSDQHRQESTANALMVSVAEQIKSETYSPCWASAGYKTPSYYPSIDSSSLTLPTGWSASNVAVSVQYWNPQSSTWDPTTPPSPGTVPGTGVCHDDPSSASLFPTQLVTVAVTSPTGQVLRSVSLVKSGSPS